MIKIGSFTVTLRGTEPELISLFSLIASNGGVAIGLVGFKTYNSIFHTVI